MAGNLMRKGQQYSTAVCEYAVDSVDEIEYLPTTTKRATGQFADDPRFSSCPPIGSICIVGNEGGDLLVYMLFSFGWKALNS